MKKNLLALLLLMCGINISGQNIDNETLKVLRNETIRTMDLMKMTQLCSMYDEYRKKLTGKPLGLSYEDSVRHWEYNIRWYHLRHMKPAELERYGAEILKIKDCDKFCYIIASVYEDIDARKAIDWYRNALYYGKSTYAMTYIADLYHNGGKKLSPDYPRAIYWYYKISDEYPYSYYDAGEKARKRLKQFKNQGYITEKTIQKLLAIDSEEKKYMPKTVDDNLFISKVKADNVYAVIIANEKYKYESEVDFATHDGKIMEQYCLQTLGIPSDCILFRENCTFNQIKLLLNTLRKKIEDSGRTGTKILFYYAGHGIPDDATKTSCLLPVDGFGSDFSSGYSLKQLYGELSRMTSGAVIVMLDACFSGTLRSGDMMKTGTRGIAIKVKPDIPPANVAVLSASQSDQAAFAYTEKRHGLFTYFLLEKLKESKGEATLEELSDYVTSHVSDSSMSIYHKSQTPTVYSINSSKDWMKWKLK